MSLYDVLAEVDEATCGAERPRGATVGGASGSAAPAGESGGSAGAASSMAADADAGDEIEDGGGRDGRGSLEALVFARLRSYAASLQGHEARDMYALIMPQLERPLVQIALELAQGRQRQAAEMLGIHRNTLRIRLRELGLERPTPRARAARQR